MMLKVRLLIFFFQHPFKLFAIQTIVAFVKSKWKLHPLIIKPIKVFIAQHKAIAIGLATAIESVAIVTAQKRLKPLLIQLLNDFFHFIL